MAVLAARMDLYCLLVSFKISLLAVSTGLCCDTYSIRKKFESSVFIIPVIVFAFQCLNSGKSLSEQVDFGDRT